MSDHRDSGGPLTHAEASAILARLGAAGVMKQIPQVRPLTARESERRRALAIVAQAIVEQAQKCDALEQQDAPEEPR